MKFKLDLLAKGRPRSL